ncbi:MAG: hypothetical protein Q8N99_02145 [Nanoarchaeota archaeon]|nr:hypothetical protein [Nanoarchaeota archaeon]
MKKGMFIFLGSLILIQIALISAIKLDVSVKPISDGFITDLNEPAVFDIVLKNLENDDIFNIYSIVGVDINPKNIINLKNNETKTIKIYVSPQEALRSKKGFLTFEYLIKNSKDEVQTERLSINILTLGDAISVSLSNINPESSLLKASTKNTITHDFPDLKMTFNSAFFSYQKDLPLLGLEAKEFDIPIDKEKLKTSIAGKYIVDLKVETGGKVSEKEVMIRFLEQENIDTEEYEEGIFIKRVEVTKNNLGNVKKSVEIRIKRNLFSYLFTNFNIEPKDIQSEGISRTYIWDKELAPNEQYKIIVKTNWLYPIIVILLIIILAVLLNIYLKTELIVRKNIYFVKTKGGEFALRIHIKVKAKKYCERINITDKIPSIVTLYERFGAVSPDKIDLANKRLEWDIEALNPGEERIFSYIVYSKIGIIGRFELPPAKAIYERDGIIKDTVSNKAYFINNPARRRM